MGVKGRNRQTVVFEYENYDLVCQTKPQPRGGQIYGSSGNSSTSTIFVDNGGRGKPPRYWR